MMLWGGMPVTRPQAIGKLIRVYKSCDSFKYWPMADLYGDLMVERGYITWQERRQLEDKYLKII